ncbi:hypothetical protein P3T37_007107 [Kitasatospora sp. MAA4]|uniref:DUF4276 family protein n=1 Tax=Kitasatospora sp. MAA4 TaxID=3035093 RepID=UPI0024741203|nr:DUF4276 family protein [Kitasatospora sp. MAA4]MDH6137674.1 hypothetical protein [Kitasatospora sp. MAA4]
METPSHRNRRGEFLVLEILLEEPSAQALIHQLAPQIMPGVQHGREFETRVFQGKEDLLRKLPQRLAGYSTWAAENDIRILVLIDRDDHDCLKLKSEIITMVNKVKGLRMLEGNSNPASGGDVKARIACEEIEAWMLGDPDALRAAYPKLPKAFENKSLYRNPDDIRGGTWERLQKLLQDHGYFSGGLRKMELARTIAPHMNPTENRSASFLSFCEAFRILI